MTTLFSDGFESGDLTQWTATYVVEDGSVSVVDEASREGSYCLKSSASTASAKAFIYKVQNFGATVYWRYYLKLSRQPESNSGLYLTYMRCGTGNDSIRLSYRDAAGTKGLVLEYDSNGDNVADSSTTYDATLAVDIWYCVELKGVHDSVNGEVRLFLNGAEVVAVSGLNLGNLDFGLLLVGLETYPAQSSVATVYSDAVEVSDSYIGVLSVEVAVADAVVLGDAVESCRWLTLVDGVSVVECSVEVGSFRGRRTRLFWCWVT